MTAIGLRRVDNDKYRSDWVVLAESIKTKNFQFAGWLYNFTMRAVEEVIVDKIQSGGFTGCRFHVIDRDSARIFEPDIKYAITEVDYPDGD